MEEIKTCNSVKLIEWLHDSVIKDEERSKDTIQQFILPLSKKMSVHLLPFEEHNAINNIKRTFEPGSEWIYFKIYCGARISDSILLNVLKPAVNSLLEKKIITKAFFLRYTDPHYHIRFRLHLSDNTNQLGFAAAISCVYNLLHPFSSNHLVWKVQLDTYEREIERYGQESILGSEVLFFHDSLLYLNCLANEDFAEDEQIRFLTALKNMDKWLSLFDMSLNEKANYCLEMSDAFEKEFGLPVKLELDLKYRELKSLLPAFLNAEEYANEFNKRDEVLNEMQMPKENLASYIHMSMNRWFITQQRLMEYMCYLFCSKYYNQVLHHKENNIKMCMKNK